MDLESKEPDRTLTIMIKALGKRLKASPGKVLLGLLVPTALITITISVSVVVQVGPFSRADPGHKTSAPVNLPGDTTASQPTQSPPSIGSGNPAIVSPKKGTTIDRCLPVTGIGQFSSDYVLWIGVHPVGSDKWYITRAAMVNDPARPDEWVSEAPVIVAETGNVTGHFEIFVAAVPGRLNSQVADRRAKSPYSQEELKSLGVVVGETVEVIRQPSTHESC